MTFVIKELKSSHRIKTPAEDTNQVNTTISSRHLVSLKLATQLKLQQKLSSQHNC